MFASTLQNWMNKGMDKEALVKILKGLLKAETDMDFLLELKKEDLRKLVAIIRDRLEG